MMVSGNWAPRAADEQGGQGKTISRFQEDIKEAFRKTREILSGLTQERFETNRAKISAGVVELEGTTEELGISIGVVHTANHVMQLFWYLRQMGIDADSGTLYFGMPPGQFSTRGAMMQASA